MRGVARMVSDKAHNCVVLLGPTASGKTAIGVRLARAFSGEIISADSRQVYRGLDIGSGKDLREYAEIPYHLIDVASLPGEYSVFNYQRDFYSVFADLLSRGKLPIIVGGTGMYLDSIIRGYDFVDVPENPELRSELATLSLEGLVNHLLTLKDEIHNRTDIIERPRLVRAIEIAEHTRAHKTGLLPSFSASALKEGASKRPDIYPLIIGICFNRTELRTRIRARLVSRLEEGLIQEVQSLHDSGISWERLERLGLEYRFTAEFLQGKISTEKEYIQSLYIAIGQFAKRQETWFRGMERKGVCIQWIDRNNEKDAEELIKANL